MSNGPMITTVKFSKFLKPLPGVESRVCTHTRLAKVAGKFWGVFFVVYILFLFTSFSAEHGHLITHYSLFHHRQLVRIPGGMH